LKIHILSTKKVYFYNFEINYTNHEDFKTAKMGIESAQLLLPFELKNGQIELKMSYLKISIFWHDYLFWMLFFMANWRKIKWVVITINMAIFLNFNLAKPDFLYVLVQLWSFAMHLDCHFKMEEVHKITVQESIAYIKTGVYVMFYFN